MQLCCRDANAHVIPVKAGIQYAVTLQSSTRRLSDSSGYWMPAYAGMTIHARTPNPLAGIAPARHEGDSRRSIRVRVCRVASFDP